MGWDYNSHIVCMCIIMRWSRKLSASWAERFRTTSLLCTYKLCDYYSPIPILSPFLFTPSLYVAILNLYDFSFNCIHLFGMNKRDGCRISLLIAGVVLHALHLPYHSYIIIHFIELIFSTCIILMKVAR